MAIGLENQGHEVDHLSRLGISPKPLPNKLLQLNYLIAVKWIKHILRYFWKRNQGGSVELGLIGHVLELHFERHADQVLGLSREGDLLLLFSDFSIKHFEGILLSLPVIGVINHQSLDLYEALLLLDVIDNEISLLTHLHPLALVEEICAFVNSQMVYLFFHLFLPYETPGTFPCSTCKSLRGVPC